MPQTTNPEDLNLENVTNLLRTKMQELERLKNLRSRHEGAIEQIMQQLRTDHNVDTIERAQALLQRRQRHVLALKRNLITKLEDLREVEERINNAVTEAESNNPIPF